MPSHAERRFIPYTPEQVFDLVADIERYPEFLPWCIGARIRQRDGDAVEADLAIGFKVYRERFTSRVTFDRPHRIYAEYAEGPFKYMHNHWLFEAADGGCLVDFDVAFEFRSRLLQTMIGVVFGEAVRRMVGAFEQRADALYG